MKFRITIEPVDDNLQVIPKAPKTKLHCVTNPEIQPDYRARFHAVTKGLTDLIWHEGMKYANGERQLALESIDEATTDEGDTDNE